MHEGLSTEESNIIDCDHLQGLALESHLKRGSEDFAEESRNNILVESRGAENEPLHVGVFALFDQMVLDVVLVDEMGNVGRSGVGGIAASINRTCTQRIGRPASGTHRREPFLDPLPVRRFQLQPGLCIASAGCLC